MAQTHHHEGWKIVLAFVLVYVFWGSTYLGIRIAVEQIPPALMCAIRFSVAGWVMLAWCRLSGRPVRLSARQLNQFAVIGILLLMGGNLTLSYAERIVPSGLSALLVAIVPLWFLILDKLLLGDHRITTRAVAGLALGIAGVVVLLWPDLKATGALRRNELLAALTLPCGSFSWALGSVLAKRWESQADRLSATAWQMVFAGIANFIFAVAVEDVSHVTWTRRGIGSVLYLVVCGSWIGYTAYIYLLGHVPTSKVSTYAFVNPVVAVFLGWAIEHEVVNRFILAGTVIVVISVILATSADVKRRSPEEMPRVEIGD